MQFTHASIHAVLVDDLTDDLADGKEEEEDVEEEGRRRRRREGHTVYIQIDRMVPPNEQPIRVVETLDSDTLGEALFPPTSLRASSVVVVPLWSKQRALAHILDTTHTPIASRGTFRLSASYLTQLVEAAYAGKESASIRCVCGRGGNNNVALAEILRLDDEANVDDFAVNSLAYYGANDGDDPKLCRIVDPPDNEGRYGIEFLDDEEPRDVGYASS